MFVLVLLYTTPELPEEYLFLNRTRANLRCGCSSRKVRGGRRENRERSKLL